jgi:predicted membrane-bound spermidine synthase
MLPLFALAIFMGATLLFLVQPLAAKLILPLLGGSPAVWNTCLVFYQTLLLAGYAYAHAIAGLRPRLQLAIHGPLLLVAGLTLPIALPGGWEPPQTNSPIGWVIMLMLVMVGAPFFIVSTASPLLQSWFSRSGHHHSKDPYFLYAASNAGSFLGLLAYPFLLEPQLTLRAQGVAWSIGYAAFAVLAVACGSVMISRAVRGAPGEEHVPEPPASGVVGVEPVGAGAAEGGVERIGAPRMVYWVALAAIPSSLMLGVTHHITTDIAAVPFLWVLPLGLYLLTFVITFSTLRLPPNGLLGWLFRLAAILAMGLPLLRAGGVDLIHETPKIGVLIHLMVLVFAALFFHKKLADDRPHASHLTRFYLLMSLGGVIGGAFNAMAAPFLFDWIAEYPIVILIGCFFTVAKTSEAAHWLRRLALRAVSTLTSLVLILAILLVGADFLGPSVIEAERTFFGVLRVTARPEAIDDREVVVHRFSHGTTVHGSQLWDDELRGEPTSYHARVSGIGQLLTHYADHPLGERVSIVGLGVGVLAAYGVPGQHMTFYEIDPEVVRIAEDPELFTFLRDTDASYDVVVGDARLRIREAEDHGFGLIVLDAFSSDAVPIHLLTREALELYTSKLAEGGIIAIHISNRFLDLGSPVASTAKSLGYEVFWYDGYEGRPAFEDVPNLNKAGWAAWWIFITRDPASLQRFVDRGGRLAVITTNDERDVWTDNYSNLWRTFKLAR